MFGIGPFELIFVVAALLLGGVLPMVCCWRIIEKTGYPAWWSLGILLPGVNLALLIMLAFSDWPALKGQDLGPDRT